MTRVVALSGGVGGAKLVLGLSRVLDGPELAVVVNTGDDFAHLGLHVAPDIDTVVYTLAGLANPETGWGRRDETWSFMRALETLGGETWFRLGDADLAMHIERTRRLAAGERLTRITRDIAARLGIATRVLPMSDDPVRTVALTEAGELAFQDYFVRHQSGPRLHALRFDGAAEARATPEVLEALRSPALEAVVIGPSNPFLSIDPMLALTDLRAAIRATGVPVVAVSPIVGGRAIKGPAAKIMAELGLPVDAAAVAGYYRGLIDGFVLDLADAATAGSIDLPTRAVPTVMQDLADREALAREVLAFAAGLRAAR
jgi:LPPG:FO 2-phospho-L-lactate transferase